MSKRNCKYECQGLTDGLLQTSSEFMMPWCPVFVSDNRQHIRRVVREKIASGSPTRRETCL